MWRNKHKWGAVFGLLALLLSPMSVFAQTSSSPNYQVDQTFFGTGGELDAQSNSFSSRQTAGELAIGLTDSQNFRALAGFNTTDEPYIEFVVSPANIDLGIFNTTTPNTASAQFYVRAWQSHGYVVHNEADPPTNPSGGAQIDPLPSPTASVPGTEQFGINLVDNSSPDVGANAQQAPNSSFSFGSVAAGYNTGNLFKYAKGDIIARSLESTSITTYTVSYLFNISNATPSGQYTFNHVMVATGTY